MPDGKHSLCATGTSWYPYSDILKYTACVTVCTLRRKVKIRLHPAMGRCFQHGFLEREAIDVWSLSEREPSSAEENGHSRSLSTVLLYTVLYSFAESASSHNLLDLNFRNSSGGIGIEQNTSASVYADKLHSLNKNGNTVK